MNRFNNFLLLIILSEISFVN